MGRLSLFLCLFITVIHRLDKDHKDPSDSLARGSYGLAGKDWLHRVQVLDKGCATRETGRSLHCLIIDRRRGVTPSHHHSITPSQHQSLQCRVDCKDRLHHIATIRTTPDIAIMSSTPSSRKIGCIASCAMTLLCSIVLLLQHHATDAFVTVNSHYSHSAINKPCLPLARHINNRKDCNKSPIVVYFTPQRKNEDEKLTTDSDWWQSELTLIKAPTEPSPDLLPESVALTVARSLQWVDYPQEAAGLKRVYPFLTWECRKTVTARRGADSLERFVVFGNLAPALQPFMGATYITLGEPTYLPAQPPSRGAIMSFPIMIRGHPSLCLQHPSGLQRSGIASKPPETKMVMRWKSSGGLLIRVVGW
jgi:hypothetical protein